MDNMLAWITMLAAVATLAVVALTMRRLRRPSGVGLESALREELRVSREEVARQARELREEVSSTQGKANDALLKALTALGDAQKALLTESAQATREAARVNREELDKLAQRTLDALAKLGESSRQEQEKARETLERKFTQIQESNEKKLDEMRRTVDEKLQDTLEKRLGASFKQVSERLEAVQQGLGEMRTLATGVGDLKRVLTNVKERGTWGEYQLGAILEEILTPDQFARNVSPKENGETVEFAVKLPGKSGSGGTPVWLPIDAKFPKEDYERLLEAAEQGDGEQVKTAAKALNVALHKSAKDICEKYVAPPATTDFGIMFLPTEGLYAEALRQPGLHDDLQRKYRVLMAGPTTLSAILSSLRVGFQTLAIEQRAHEVWRVLGAVKTEFGKFGAMLDKVHRQLDTATKTLDESSRRTRAMERKLRSVEELTPDQAATTLALPEGDEESGSKEK